MNTTSARPLVVESNHIHQKLNISQLVNKASHVITPYGPIDKFAARNPWAGMESEPFEKVAKKLKAMTNVDILPNQMMIKKAWEHREINEDILIKKLEQWIRKHVSHIPFDQAKAFCLAGVMDFNTKFENTSEIQAMARKLARFQMPFDDHKTVKTYSQILEQNGISQDASRVNQSMIKWCKLFLDQSQALWSMPNREKGFFVAWKNVICFDPDYKDYLGEIGNLPDHATEALQYSLQQLNIPQKDIQEYIEAHLLALPGWAGMILWRAENISGEEELLTEYLAVRVTLESLLVKKHLPLQKDHTKKEVDFEQLVAAWFQWGKMSPSSWFRLSFSEIRARLKLAYDFNELVRKQLWLEAWEETYESQLRQKITSVQGNVTQTASVLAQFVFCIDVRSEPFRRQLENAGPFETIGTAGFFGLPIETCELGKHHAHPSLPVMFKPQYKVNETLHDEGLENYFERIRTGFAVTKTFKSMKHQLLTSMLLPEISGPYLTVQTLARSLTPKMAGSALRKIRKKWLKKPTTTLTINRETNSEELLPIGFSKEERVYYTRQALLMMGLTKHFAPLVVICGHGSISTNNPYASSLDCGACGGASSRFNARVLATLCNLPDVRNELAKDGIYIPEETMFVAAEHITSLDELHWVDVPELTTAAKEAMKIVEDVLPEVSEKANAERISKLPGVKAINYQPRREAVRLAEDWSEIRPEWGLARNASFIIGKRELTSFCHLDSRSFLQNYDWEMDPDGTILNHIISGPVTVAQWINLQYYASTVAPYYYGSGNKTTQTVTAGVGVMQGNASDLLIGLPWQSVMLSDEEAYHTPIRLLIVIQAPRSHIERLLNNNHDFHQKLKNGWIRLASIGPDREWSSWS